MKSSGRSTQKRDAPMLNPFEDVERIASLVMQEAQMSMRRASRIVGKLFAMYVLGLFLASNCCFSWYVAPVGIFTLSMAFGWLDAIGKECRCHRFFPSRTLNSVGASLFRWQWVPIWACVCFGVSFIGSIAPFNWDQLPVSERLAKIGLMAGAPLTLMLLGRALEVGSAHRFQQARSDVQKAEALVRQLAASCQTKAGTSPFSPLVEHEKIPLYKLGSVAKALHDVVASYDSNAKLKLEVEQSQRALPKGYLHKLFYVAWAPFRKVSSDFFLWESRDIVLHIVAALYVAMVYYYVEPWTAHAGVLCLPVCVLAPFMICKSKAVRYVRALHEDVRLAQRSSPRARPLVGVVPSIAEIRAAIPAECFKRSALRSLSLVLRDGVMMTCLVVVATYLLRVPGFGSSLSVADYVGWALYGFWQGTVATGWWVLAHECGHGAFSESTTLNNSVGFILHSLLLVPYFSWQYSHGKHHSKTNHLLDGETHVPDTKDDLADIGAVQLYRLLGKNGFALLQLVGHLVFGWPAYLFFYATGGRRLQGKPVSKPLSMSADHFRPNSDLFPLNWKNRVALSSLGLAFVLAGLAWCTWSFGFGAVVVYYLLPYLWVNFWLVLYTWLQHTDPSVPHYGESDWTWVKGALCTIDRPYGIFDFFHHHIGSTHVCHHLFSTLPSYNAREATQHLKALLKPLGLYNYDSTFWPIAAWKVATTCHYVDGAEGTQYYKCIDELNKVGQKEEPTYEPHLWYIHGNSYDLSGFVEKHPGGAFAILSARGRDCTALFECYHPWTDNNRKLLAAYGPKPPTCDPFYQELKEGVRKLFPLGPKETKLRTTTLAVLWTSYALEMYLFFVVQTWWSCLLAGVIIGLVTTRLSHEGGHFQASHKPWVNRLTLFFGYLPVAPSLCWYYRHVISHHPCTNHDNDVDVAYFGILDMLPKCLNFAKVLSLPFTFMGAVVEIGLKTEFDLLVMKNVAGHRVYYDVGGLIPEAIAWLVFHMIFGPPLWCYPIMWLTAGGVFVPGSQVAHAIIYPEALEDESWAIRQIKACVNFAPRSSFWYHASFGLTTQIEHHLFPGIAAYCYDDIHDYVVKPVCAKYQVPVYDITAKKAFQALWQRLLSGQAVKLD